jgi:hypothetical protein
MTLYHICGENEGITLRDRSQDGRVVRSFLRFQAIRQERLLLHFIFPKVIRVEALQNFLPLLSFF